MTRRRLVPAELVAGGLGAVCCPHRWCYLGEHEVHGLARDPSVHGLPLATVARCMTGHDYIDRWLYICHVPECRVNSSAELDGADAWARALHAAHEHIHTDHPDLERGALR